MPIVELRCTSCNAPLEMTSAAGPHPCKFCGAVLLVTPDAKAPAGPTHEVFAVTLRRVGPSNRARVARVLHERAEIPESEAERFVAHVPIEIARWKEHDRARELHDAILEAGADATMETHVIADPLPAVLPPLAVRLDRVGEHKITVIKLVHQHLDLGMIEAKELVERAPCVLVESLEGGRAKALRDALREAGADARAD